MRERRLEERQIPESNFCWDVGLCEGWATKKAEYVDCAQAQLTTNRPPLTREGTVHLSRTAEARCQTNDRRQGVQKEDQKNLVKRSEDGIAGSGKVGIMFRMSSVEPFAAA